MAKKKTTKARKATMAKKTSVKRTVSAKPVAFYKQPMMALSNGFDRVFSFFK